MKHMTFETQDILTNTSPYIGILCIQIIDCFHMSIHRQPEILTSFDSMNIKEEDFLKFFSELNLKLGLKTINSPTGPFGAREAGSVLELAKKLMSSYVFDKKSRVLFAKLTASTTKTFKASYIDDIQVQVEAALSGKPSPADSWAADSWAAYLNERNK